jgi:hypothetical protein
MDVHVPYNTRHTSRPEGEVTTKIKVKIKNEK